MTQTSEDVTWLTQEAYTKLKEELAYLSGPARDEVTAKIAAARGRHILMARRVFAVAPTVEQSGLDQRVQPARQHVGRDTEAVLELVEARHPVQSVAHDEHAPPFTHALQAAGDRTSHFFKALALH